MPSQFQPPIPVVNCCLPLLRERVERVDTPGPRPRVFGWVFDVGPADVALACRWHTTSPPAWIRKLSASFGEPQAPARLALFFFFRSVRPVPCAPSRDRSSFVAGFRAQLAAHRAGLRAAQGPPNPRRPPKKALMLAREAAIVFACQAVECRR